MLGSGRAAGVGELSYPPAGGSIRVELCRSQNRANRPRGPTPVPPHTRPSDGGALSEFDLGAVEFELSVLQREREALMAGSGGPSTSGGWGFEPTLWALARVGESLQSSPRHDWEFRAK